MAKFYPLIITLLTLCAFGLPAQELDMDGIKAEENFRWGVRAFHNGYYNDAILSLEKALSFKPAWIPPRLWLGNALYKSGFEEAALNEWGYILETEADSVLKNRVEVISHRRGLSRELEKKDRWVVAGEINAEEEGYYPFRRPSSVRIRKDGTVYLVAFASNEIVILDVNHQVRNVLRGGLKGFDQPFDLLEINDHLFISEYGRNKLLKCNLRGERIKEFGGMGSGDGKLLGPQYLATDGKGYIYVTDWGNARVSKYDLEGNFILAFGGRDSSYSALRGPTGIAIGGERVYVSDRRLKRIEVFDLSGNFLSSFGQDFLAQPEGIILKDKDTLLVADGSRVLEYQIQKEIWKTLTDIASYSRTRRLTNLAFNPNDELYVVDFDLNKLFILSRMRPLYTGLYVQVERIVSTDFPENFIDLSVEDRLGNPIVGLKEENFLVTEFYRDVGELSLVRSNTDPAPLELVVLVEKSLPMKEHSRDLRAAVESIYTQAEGLGRIQIISAGRKPVLEADFGATRLETVRAATKLEGVRDRSWRFDLSVRMAAAALIPGHSKKAIILLTRGQLPADAFDEYSLTETTKNLCNNFISFYTVSFGADTSGGELEYISAETGGKNYNYFDPLSIEQIITDIRSRVSPLYTLRYISPSDPDFGRRYIELQLTVTLLRKSGRGESGYFAPLTD